MNKSRIIFTGLLTLLFIFNLKAQAQEYYFAKDLDMSVEQTMEAVNKALKAQGFGVVSETKMHETLMEKVPGFQMDPYIVLGACNAKIAIKVLEMEEYIGLLLPCKVLIRYKDDSTTEVAIMDPSVAMSVVGNKEIETYLDEVTALLKKVLKSL